MSRYDEEARYDRPKRRTRPRTKDRPSYDDAATGFVITRDRGRYTCWVEPGDRVVTAMKARQLGRKGVIVGDRVKLDGDASGDEGTLARIVEVLPRTTLLRRSADDDDPVERPLVANADQLVIVVAVANPEPRTGLIDRFLVAAYDAGMRPLLCLTKTDLADPDPLLAIRPWASYVGQCPGTAVARRRLDHRHPGDPVVRPGPRRARPPHPRFPGLGRDLG